MSTTSKIVFPKDTDSLLDSCVRLNTATGKIGNREVIVSLWHSHDTDHRVTSVTIDGRKSAVILMFKADCDVLTLSKSGATDKFLGKMTYRDPGDWGMRYTDDTVVFHPTTLKSDWKKLEEAEIKVTFDYLNNNDFEELLDYLDE